MKIPAFDREQELFYTFGKDFDRFGFPAEIYRVTGGHGGESFLIVGSEKTALYDCGMAYCGEDTVRNIEETLESLVKEGKVSYPSLDYILLSHSHYDHIGALPYILDRYPDTTVCASAKCQSVLGRENARKLIAELGNEAKELYTPDSDITIRTDNFRVDHVLCDGDTISLGEETITAYETKGHTDCSLSYLLEPVGLLFTSESTGILEQEDYVHTPSLKSFPDSLASAEKCKGLCAKYLCLPHSGMVPEHFQDKYFDMFEAEVASKMGFVRSMLKEGLTYDEMLAQYVKRYWTPAKEIEQPIEAFEINSGHILNALIRAVEEEGDNKDV